MDSWLKTGRLAKTKIHISSSRYILYKIKTNGLAIETAILLLQTMSGIYIHIPFCRKACHYCNFHFSTSLHRKPELLDALKKEIGSFTIPAALSNDDRVETLYIGGGTPSILTAGELGGLLEKVQGRFLLADDAEITLEANPDDITAKKLESWKQMGVNRLSIGIQSFRGEDLEWMNRAHNAGQAYRCIELAYAAGFANLNIDLIFGTPTLHHAAWLANLEQAKRMGITHLSCYALTVEENTALHHFIKKGKVPMPPEEKQARQFEMLMDWADQSGWEHYEISNLCKPGHRSRHNSNYWTGRPYFGFGPSAHSFDGNLTRWNGIANNAIYIKDWLEGNGTPYLSEKLTLRQRFNEKIMTGLRQKEGISFPSESGSLQGLSLSEKEMQNFLRTIDDFLSQGLLVKEKENICLSRRGKLFADHIAASLFL
jgi:oxygen-independent coproporphyrinogen-3 oxidase